MLRRTLALVCGLGLTALGCGADTLTRPVGLTTDTFAANTPFRLTLVMQNCRQACLTYETATCEVEVREDDRILRVSPEVEISDPEDGCSTTRCDGAAVLASCDVGALSAGTWVVEATDGNFSDTITVR